jgi:signal transduction histidine kinase/DNA-binding LacI/PurR family transcriptional regulator/CheY-like chemotaxis protein
MDAARARSANAILFAGYVLDVPSFERQRNVLYELIDVERVDSLVVWSSSLDAIIGAEGMKRFCQQFHPLPLVSVERTIEGFPSALMDDYQGVYAAMIHFIEQHGYGRIAFISGPKNHAGAQERYRAYAEALAHHGLSLDPDLVTPPTSHWNDEESRAIFTQWLDERTPDFEALMGVNDNYTLVALEVLEARGIRVPDDVAAAGFDDIPPSASLTVPLTTIRPPFYELGWKAAEMALNLAAGIPVAAHTALPTKLIVRQSCGCLSPIAIQSVTGLIGAIPDRAAASESAPVARPKQTLAEVARVVELHHLGIAAQSAKQLLDALLADVAGETNSRFLFTLNRLLRETSADRTGVAWYRVLSILRRELFVQLAEPTLARRAEDLWQQAHILVGEAELRTEMRQTWQEQQRAAAFRRLGQELITTFDVAKLMDVVAQELPLLGIRRCYLALYENPQAPAEQARLILAYDEQDRVALPPGGLVFPSRQLLPQELWRRHLSYNLFMEALSFQEQQLGFVLFEAASREEWIFETLRGQLSSSLKGALLVEQTEQARAAAEQANAAKSIFLANMSHELRTPLNSILGFAQILQQRVEPNSPLLDGLTTIQQSGEHLLTLINDILDLARIESGKLDLTPSDIHLPTFLGAIANLIRVRADAKELRFTHSTDPNLPPVILADETRLRQVLLNLLGNAVKFTDRGQVTLRVRLADQRPTTNDQRPISDDDPAFVVRRSSVVRFEVEDTGPGIPAEELARLFQPFEQGGELARHEGGAGLGLAISRQLVRAMGSDIQVTSVVGQGSTFWFELSVPVLETLVREHSTSRLVTGYTGRPRSVLVVDDIATNRALLIELLTGLGFTVYEAANGQEGLDQAQERQPDLILMDRTMPVLDGHQATRRIRQLPALQHTPIIAVSASVAEPDRTASLQVGADAFVPKPIHQDELLEQIGRLLQLEWVEVKPVVSEDAAAQVGPPPEQARVFYELARRGRIKELQAQIEELEQHGLEYRAFASELRQLAQRYRLREIRAMLEPYVQETSRDSRASE